MTEMACDELVDVITDYLEGALPAADARRFEAHLGDCESCTSYLEQMRDTVARLDGVAADTLSADARKGVLDAFAGWRDRSV
jgi:anti-sigma factor RsiW